MSYTAQQIHGALAALKGIEDVGIKTASAADCVLTQRVRSTGCSAFYDSMCKEASIQVPETNSHSVKMLVFIDKIASELGAAPLSEAMQLKIAAAMQSDAVLSIMAKDVSQPQEQVKLAEAKAYGRELFVDLLAGVLL